MLDALERTFQVPEYLLRMIRDYPKDKQLLYDTLGRASQKIYHRCRGTRFDLGTGPMECHSYDGILRVEMPKGAFLVCYADGIVAVIVTRDVEIVQIRLNQVMSRVNCCM